MYKKKNDGDTYSDLERTTNHYPWIDWNEILTLEAQSSCSFVIPTHNSTPSLHLVINSIEQQNLVGNISEVIIVDDASDDGLVDTIEEITSSSNLNIIYLRNASREYSAYSRNRGIQRATGDIICFIDSDILIPPNYLNHHLGMHAISPTSIGITLRTDIVLADNNGSVSTGIPVELNDDFRRGIVQNTNGLRNLKVVSNDNPSLPELCLTCAVSYRRDDLVEVRGCPTNFKGWGFNDTAMAAKVIVLGRYVIPTDGCEVLHIAHPPRSGDKQRKQHEYELNRKRYERMLGLSLAETSKDFISGLDF